MAQGVLIKETEITSRGRFAIWKKSLVLNGDKIILDLTILPNNKIKQKPPRGRRGNEIKAK
jgi:hypothetical protein